MEGVKKITTIDDFVEVFGKWYGMIANENVTKYFLAIGTAGRVGLANPNTWDKTIKYTPTQIKGIPPNKHCAYYKECAYLLDSIKKAKNLIHPNSYGFHNDQGDELLCLKNGVNIIVIAPIVRGLWKELAHIPIEDIMKDRPSSVLVI